MSSPQDLFVTVALRAWKQNIDRANKFFSGLSEEQLLKEVAPGKNRLIYLWGHLTAVSDGMLPLLGLGERLHPELDAIFITSPDRTHSELLPALEMKRIWDEINDKLRLGFAGFTTRAVVGKTHCRLGRRLCEGAAPESLCDPAGPDQSSWLSLRTGSSHSVKQIEKSPGSFAGAFSL